MIKPHDHQQQGSIWKPYDTNYHHHQPKLFVELNWIDDDNDEFFLLGYSYFYW